MIASIAEYKPGETIETHIHHGVETGYVVQGAMVQVPGRDPAPFTYRSDCAQPP